MMDADGHLKLIDFGTAKLASSSMRTKDRFSKKQERQDTVEMSSEVSQKFQERNTFVGTAQYLAPEVLEDRDCNAPADLWALGNL